MMKSVMTGAAIIALSLAGLAAAPAIKAQDVDAQTVRQAEEIALQPGEYRAKVTLEGIDIPGAPPEMANIMRSMMSREFTYCLTPEEVKEGFRAMTDRSQDERSGADDCSYKRFDVTGGKIDAVMVCTAEGRTMNMAMTGTGTPTGSDMTMTMTGDMGMGSPGAMKMNVKHERVGGC